MADPRIVNPSERKPHLSPLMLAKSKNTKGGKVNACPFGCKIENLDDNGYCHHLVGFTNDGKIYEPMIDEKVKDPFGGKDRFTGRRKVIAEIDGKDNRQPVLPTDTLVQITVSQRVYREKPAEVKQPEPTKKSA